MEKERKKVGNLIQREGAAFRKDLSKNLTREVTLGWARQRQLEERVGRVNSILRR